MARRNMAVHWRLGNHMRKRTTQTPAPIAPEQLTAKTDAMAVERRDRPYIYYNATNSLCPTCLRVIQAKILLQDNKVYMYKTCPEHGAVKTLLSSDAKYYISQAQFN